jgi:phosphoglycerate kinase
MIRFLDDLDPKGKTIIVRTDLNSDMDPKTHKIIDSFRMQEYSKTVKELSKKGAKIILLAHQGRKGDPDFIGLDQHAKLLSKHVGKKIEFVPDIVGEKAVSKIKSMKKGGIVLLDNVRFLEEETEDKTPAQHSQGNLVKTLAPLADAYVNDAFSNSHRGHASMVGFGEVLPSYAGMVMEKELKVNDVIGKMKKAVLVLGGCKCDEIFLILEKYLGKGAIDCALTSGIVGNIFLSARGVDIGKDSMDFIKKKDLFPLIDRAKGIDAKYPGKVLVPVDIAFEKGGKRSESSPGKTPMIQDIGKATIGKYCKIISRSKVVLFKGPCGVYEKPQFDQGTRKILLQIAKSKGFTIIAGGDSTTALEKLKIPIRRFSHASVGGGAFIDYISGKEMPGIAALENCKVRKKL